MPIYFRPHHTRLFPKGAGCLQVQPTGLAARCDWLLLSDFGEPHYRLINRTGVTRPKTIFISLRGGLEAIEYFDRTIRRSINNPYVLITGSEDLTIPSQTDHRWPRATKSTIECISRILESESLIRWFAENLDQHISTKMVAMPLGYVLDTAETKQVKRLKLGKSIDQRRITLFCSHRVREGPQWEERRYVSTLLEQAGYESITVVHEELASHEYEHMLSESAFVVCVRGGGIDPCPKAFQALQHGAVPVIRSSPMDKCFQDLPVWIVNDWLELVTNSTALMAKQLQFSAQPRDPQIIASRLSLDFWWAAVQAACSVS